MNVPDCRIGSVYLARMKFFGLFLGIICSAVVASKAAPSNSVARVWDERALAAIRVDTPHPPAQARNLFSLSVCMYDAWAAYDTNGAIGYVYRAKHTAADVAAARREAISYAAYRLLKERHFYSKTFAATLAADDAQMTALGYNINNVSRDTSTPAGVGNTIYDMVSAWFINDGARQTNGTQASPYPDYPVGQGGYDYINPPLATDRPGISDGFGNSVVDINHWQRLYIVNAVDQNGFPIAGPIQNYLGAQWLGVRAFALTRIDPTKPWIDFGPPPFLNGVGDNAFRTNVVECIRRSSELSPDDGVTVDISPGAFGNNTLGSNDGHGYANNPVTGTPYAPNIVRRGDFTRVLAEFWADGPNSETPPGHWNVLANYVADHPLTVKKIGGTGPVVDDLEWDVKTYFAVNAAVHDAACAAWGAKRYYDGWRPLSAIRYMGRGQSSVTGVPSYNPNGLPLIPGLIELVTSQMAATNFGLVVGRVAIHAWPGVPVDPIHQHSGVKWIHADSWLPYQRTNFITPAFPGYFSGHSTFSRSAAEVLTALTGSPYFPGGLGSYTFTTLGFENGPSAPVQLQWATYFDAADQAGLSRIWGGIHPPVDDFAGRRAGAQSGQGAWALARAYFAGLADDHPPVAVNDSATVLQDGATMINVLANDNDPADMILTSATTPAHGTCTLNADGSITYTPMFGYSGPDSFSYAIQDNHGRTASAVVNISVTALPPPVFTCPPIVVAECTGGLTPVSFIATAVDFNGSPVPVTCNPPSGTGFRLGQSNVICTATDSFGSSGSCNFAVAVVDTTPPQVSCPGDISLHTTNATGIAVDYIASAADACGLSGFSCSPASGATFAVGVTIAVCTARDGTGNSNSCSFKVTIIQDKAPICAARIACSFSSAVRSRSGDLNAYVIALNDADACVILDASGSSDPDHLPLQFSWIIDGTNTVPGMVVTNCFDLGCHSVVLEVNNGRLTSRCPTNVCAITGSEAVEQCIALVDGASVDRKNLRPLIATLKAVSAAMDRGDLIPAMNGLEAFRNKVAAQIAPANPTEAASFIAAIQHILDAINCAAVVGTAAGQQ